MHLRYFPRAGTSTRLSRQPSAEPRAARCIRSMKTATHNEDTHMLRSTPRNNRLAHGLAASLLALACLAGAQPASAALDTNAYTTDHNTNVPAGWWMYNGLTAAQVNSYA